MMVLVLISFNSLILLYFVTSFQDAQESQGGSREANSTKSLFTASHLSQIISLGMTWMNWCKSRNSIKVPPKQLRTTHWNCPIHSIRDFGVDEKGGGASHPPTPTSRLWAQQTPVLLITCQRCHFCSGGCWNPHESHTVWHEASYR